MKQDRIEEASRLCPFSHRQQTSDRAPAKRGGCKAGVSLVAATMLLATSFEATAAWADGSYGAPGYTDELANAPGTFDIIGMKLGMPIDDALKILKAYDPKIEIAPHGGHFEVAPDLKLVPFYRAADTLTRDGQFQNGVDEHFELSTTTAPGKSYLWGIGRDYHYVDPSKQPLAKNVIASLKEKYGPPSEENDVTRHTDLYWYIKQDGTLFKRATPNDACGIDNGLNSIGSPPGYLDEIAKGMAGAIVNGNQQQVDTWLASPVCGYAIRAQIMLGYDDQGLLQEMTVSVDNWRLKWAGFEATHAALMKAQDAADSAAKQNASQQNGPAL
jgi:hypothetical protein